MLPWPTSVHVPNGISIGSAIFVLYMSDSFLRYWRYINHLLTYLLYNGPPFFPLKIAPLHGDLYLHLIHDSFCPPESTTQTASWPIQWCRPHNCDRQTDQQTDHTTPSVTIGRISVCSTVMQPKS